jgi:hypothetical protein
MRVTFYSAVVLVAAGSVVFGLDWMSAPMPPMPEAKNVVFAPPPPPPAPRAVPAPAVAPNVVAPSAPANAPAAGQPNPQSVSANPSAAPVASSPSVQAPAVNQAPAPVAAAPQIKCDIDVCAAAYRSFRESDCTYNPSFGPRRLCTKGDPEKYARDHPQTAAPAASTAPATPAAAPAAEVPAVAQTAEPGAIMAPEPGTTPATAAAPPRCNVSACAAAYPRSFRAEDCTFNPSSGPRRVCEK